MSLAAVYFDDAVFYRKAGGVPVAAPAVPAAPVASARAVVAPTRPPAAAKPELRPGRPTPLTPLAAAVADHDDGHRLAQLARAHADAGRLAPALEAIEQALAGRKLDAGMHHLHAVILIEMGQAERARAALRRALYLEPNFVIAHHALAQLALREDEPASAERHLRNMLRLLDGTAPDDVLPGSGGMAAGQLRDLVSAAARGRAGQ